MQWGLWPGAQPGDFKNNAVIGKYRIYMDSVAKIDRATIAVNSLNGKGLSTDTTYVLTPPGKYKAAIWMIGPDPEGRNTAGVRWTDEVEFIVQAGHTYRPNRTRQGNYARLYMEDLGPGFPIECLQFVADPKALGLPPTCEQP